MNVLITGGLGVNGSWVTRKLVERGLRPVVLDNRADTSLIGPECARAVTIVEGDLTDPALLRRVLAEQAIERVVHLAALIGHPDDPGAVFAVNAQATVHLLEAARQAGVRRFVFSSSRAAYGAIEGEHAHPTYRPIAEDHPLRPVHVYDVCKVASESMGRCYASQFGMEFVALRFATIFGPGKTLRHKNFSILSRIIEEPLHGRPVRIPRGGDQRDDMIYADDVAEAIVLALLHPKPRYTEYNISHARATTLHDLADAVRRQVPRADIEIAGGLDYIGSGVNYAGILDNTRARADLGFEPRFSLDSAVADYIRQMKSLRLPPFDR
ncbi:NAD(P)-dependent oxidoreductase [Ramlibacter sp. AW1]|uniref:NAD(P)-dependent oxidoreductase n=1 Tax=Ramlibacter aurantiacus TaxID=2801330 RepID=A0A936ZEP1_9BURK|nr:NAD(P)-dependent oxidoreductase [Ramlibacter aurantiacus]MBL0418903.1 NAD(P)-dependent oxidoreductase [Ramlibacter aurantiacus]